MCAMASEEVLLHQSLEDIRTLDRKFRRACDQILLLNNCIDDLQSRYSSAMQLNRRSFRYSLRLKLATLEGVRNMFYEYASRCADSLEGLQADLLPGEGEPVDDVDSDTAEMEDQADSGADTVNRRLEDSRAGTEVSVVEHPVPVALGHVDGLEESTVAAGTSPPEAAAGSVGRSQSQQLAAAPCDEDGTDVVTHDDLGVQDTGENHV